MSPLPMAWVLEWFDCHLSAWMGEGMDRLPLAWLLEGLACLLSAWVGEG